MASSLLKTLRNIEIGRQNIIHDLNVMGIPTEKNASFAKIGANLEGVSLTSNNKYITVPQGPFYNNPEDDPAVWKKPESWPDIAKLFDELVAADTKFSDYACRIKQIIMFQTSEDTTVFANQNTSLTDNMISGFYHPNNIKAYIMTSDGVLYEKTNSMKTVTHTWDHSKDLIGPTGEHFKYIVTFIGNNESSSRTDASAIKSLNVGSKIKLNQILTDPSHVEWSAGSNSSYNNSNTLIPYHVIKFDMRQIYRTIITLPNVYNLRTDILIKKEELQEGTHVSTDYYPIINTFYVKDINAELNFSKIILYNTAKYIRVNSLSISSIKTLQNNATSIYNTTDYIASGLKYLELPDNKNLTCTKKIMFPCLKDIDKVVYLVKNTSDTFGPFQANNPILHLDGFPNTSNPLQGVSARTLIIDDASNYNDITGAINNLESEVLVLNNLKILSKPITDERSNFRVLIIPDLETISTSLCTSNSTYNKNYIQYLKAPKLTQITTSSTPFTNCNNIVYLEIGEEFFGNLDISPLKNISTESTIDIINKLKDLTITGESYTITLPIILKYTLDSSIFEIATNKGWTVSYN